MPPSKLCTSHQHTTIDTCMGVSKNNRTPKSSILFIVVSIIFTIHFGGPPLFLETSISLFPSLTHHSSKKKTPMAMPESWRTASKTKSSAFNTWRTKKTLFAKWFGYMVDLPETNIHVYKSKPCYFVNSNLDHLRSICIYIYINNLYIYTLHGNP